MTWLMENPVAIVVGGVIVELVLAIALLRSGRGLFLVLMVAAGLLGLGLLAIERLVVTDSEAVRATLDQTAAALVTNDPERVLAFVDPAAKDVRQRAKAILPHFVFEEAHIAGDVELTFHPQTSPPSVTAQCRAYFRAHERQGSTYGHDQALERLRVELHKVDGRWLITDAEPVDRRM